MSKKLKIGREYTFKAYAVETLENVNANLHSGEFLFKSECHYYCEKYVLDLINANVENAKNYLIYKISTLEDSNIEDMLIEQIFVKDGIIYIK